MKPRRPIDLPNHFRNRLQEAARFSRDSSVDLPLWEKLWFWMRENDSHLVKTLSGITELLLKSE